MFFFLPFTCFSKLLSLWLITEVDDILWSVSFEGAGDEIWSCFVTADCFTTEDCFNAENNDEKLGGSAEVVLGGATGTIGIPKNFFTSGFFITAKLD